MSEVRRLLRSNLKFKNLQLLVTLDDFRHVSKAAEAVHLTQPALSKALAELEAMVSTRLFERTSRGLEPTAQGQVLIRFARESMAQLERVAEDFHAIGTESTGLVRVGAMMTASALLIPRSIVRMKQIHPYATVHIEEALIEELIERLRVGQVDVVIGRLDAINDTNGLILEELYADGVTVVCAPMDPIADHATLRWPDLQDRPWILPPPGSNARKKVEAQYAQHAMRTPADLVETSSFLSMVALVQERGALGILAETPARHFQSLGLIRILPLPLTQAGSSIGLVHIRNRTTSSLEQLFCNCAKHAAEGITEW